MKRALFLALLLVLAPGCHHGQKDLSNIPTDRITELHVPDAFNFWDARPKDIQDSGSSVFFSVGYQVKTAYPAQSVISYYQQQLAGTDFVPYTASQFTHGVYQWGLSIDNSSKTPTCVYQYAQDWISQDGLRVALVMVQYHSPTNASSSCDPTPDNDLAEVYVVSRPAQ